MEKQIKNNGNIIRIMIEQGYCSDSVQITKAFFENEELEKTISFSIGDDMSFNTYIFNEELYLDIKELSFEIDIDDQIYFALNRMLGKTNSLVIDDDNTREKLKNFLIIKRSKNKIIITFHDENTEKPLFERFTIFIKNICSDSRSKIDDFNVKYRLVRFFREAEEILTNDCHQYSLDECFELLKQQGIYAEGNPFLYKKIGYCELYETADVPRGMDYWCSSYLKKGEQIQVKKLLPNNKK